MSADGWVARTVLLILAVVATMAMISAIASISNGAPALPGGPAPGPGELSVGGDATGVVVPGTAPAAPPEATAKSWLEPLTYAVLALAGFAAAALIVLLRIAASLRDIADRSAGGGWR